MMVKEQNVSQPEKNQPTDQNEELKIVLTSDLIEEELKRVKHKNSYKRVLKSTIGVLIAVMAAVVLVVVMFLPVLQISGDHLTRLEMASFYCHHDVAIVQCLRHRIA